MFFWLMHSNNQTFQDGGIGGGEIRDGGAGGKDWKERV
jgi:hypothetical protein